MAWRSKRLVTEVQRMYQEAEREPCPTYFVHTEDSAVDHWQVLVLGPSNSPYANAAFEMSMKFDASYPIQPPSCQWLTTDCGRVRYGPNLYAGGKICLSILGTYSGEKWSAAMRGNSVILATQSLMDDEPFSKEPGFEKALASRGHPEALEYNDKLCHEVIRHAVCDQVEKALAGTLSSVFNQHRLELFRQYLCQFEALAATQSKKIKAGKPMMKTPFEFSGNGIEGVFQWPGLQDRLKGLRTKIDKQTSDWAAFKPSPALLQSRQVQLCEAQEKMRGRVLIEPVSQTLSEWKCIFLAWGTVAGDSEWQPYFGAGVPTTPLHIVLPPRESGLPRARFVGKPVFHPSVAPDGVPFVALPQRPELAPGDVVERVHKILAEEPMPHPAALLNEEARTLWTAKGVQGKMECSRRASVSAAPPNLGKKRPQPDSAVILVDDDDDDVVVVSSTAPVSAAANEDCVIVEHDSLMSARRASKRAARS
eukprot:CAMPEP_0114542880 /NCGR_PEP_ID=MMETSP0114-20121206/2061_1 /TAXON_ID=31324 /ORGANISM="Goniomonas sp, Strain m" /LENGTH=478 /DNA_ID=CAMNT_0001727187 /DNA_START=68 /DNA_END=1504 /DNA_ORIENTATION=+